ncbi:uncharacterized protein PHACADRAFT_263204 [Phanerochaete carnosa HHB-10118-sp]|uniref:Extracellular metalloproteinase n=1 Tax=Phanerochaete carnosa (strain HHB-10118-sp) TaxID=650164 RepID=K5VIS9_PHACS|nr:uncharacterized protein PHACADRAFT_263204 [Phanerochaete carnosa HHB-10118-sp]EKM51193.1 hypothetical protein PHACADRAFT_263204 [Phanerochaete carnosa HHB-10118-sp]
MAHNWYAAAVTYSQPHRIISVVDWAADGSSGSLTDLLGWFAPLPKEASTEVLTTRAPAKYLVHEWGLNDPTEGDRTFQYENFDVLASPVGWHVVESSSDPTAPSRGTPLFKNTSTTWGNNVIAHENWASIWEWVTQHRPKGTIGVSRGADGEESERLVFDFPYAPRATSPPETLKEAYKHINATVTQLFYTANLIHDLFYRYGFDEVSGNFQQYNFGRGGKENDVLITDAQEGSWFNSAQFFSPPDGRNGRCQIFLWNFANPYRDGVMEAGIIIHELAHGLSTRLTGGPSNSDCLSGNGGEGSGMGEGWGDFLATTVRSVKDLVADAKAAENGVRESRDYPMAAWASSKAGGLRKHPYSLDKSVNPTTYKTLDNPLYWEAHAIGEVWAQMLWVVEHHLIRKHGVSDTLFPPKPLENGKIPLGDFYRESTAGKLIPKHGNTLAVQLVISGMKLQPCRPSFLNARDAIIQADWHLTGGENYCEIWRGFASRGLGPDAHVQFSVPWWGKNLFRTEDFGVPKNCR